MIGNNADTSLEFTTGTILTDIKPFRANLAEAPENATLEQIATAVTAGYANGEYCVDHRNGIVYGIKDTTGTADTAAYKVSTQTTGGGGVLPNIVDLTKIGGVAISAKNAAFAEPPLGTGSEFEAIGALTTDGGTAGDKVPNKASAEGVPYAHLVAADGATSTIPAQGTGVMAGSLPSTIATDDTQFGAVGAASDVDGNVHGQLRYIGEAVDGLEATVATPPYTHSSGRKDFAAAYTSSTTITLSDTPATIASNQLAFITYTPTGGTLAKRLVNGQNGVTLTISSNVITVDGGGTPFASGDTYDIGVNLQIKGYDSSTDQNKVSVGNPEYAHYTDAELLVTASDIVATTTVYKDQGAEIDMRGYKTLGIFVKFTVNDSETNTIKALSKHTNAGGEEFVLETTADYIKTLGDSNINIYYEFEADGIPFVQLQSTATTVGATEGVVEIYITKR